MPSTAANRTDLSHELFIESNESSQASCTYERMRKIEDTKADKANKEKLREAMD